MLNPRFRSWASDAGSGANTQRCRAASSAPTADFPRSLDPAANPRPPHRRPVRAVDRHVTGRGRAIVIRVRHHNRRAERRLEIRVPPVRGQVAPRGAARDRPPGGVRGGAATGSRARKAAWRFALEEALVAPTDTTRRRIGKRLRSYVNWAELGGAGTATLIPPANDPSGRRTASLEVKIPGRKQSTLYEVLTGTRHFLETDALQRGDPIWSLGRIKRDQDPIEERRDVCGRAPGTT